MFVICSEFTLEFGMVISIFAVPLGRCKQNGDGFEKKRKLDSPLNFLSPSQPFIRTSQNMLRSTLLVFSQIQKPCSALQHHWAVWLKPLMISMNFIINIIDGDLTPLCHDIYQIQHMDGRK